MQASIGQKKRDMDNLFANQQNTKKGGRTQHTYSDWTFMRSQLVVLVQCLLKYQRTIHHKFVNNIYTLKGWHLFYKFGAPFCTCHLSVYCFMFTVLIPWTKVPFCVKLFLFPSLYGICECKVTWSECCFLLIIARLRKVIEFELPFTKCGIKIMCFGAKS